MYCIFPSIESVTPELGNDIVYIVTTNAFTEKFQKRLNFQDFACSYNRVKLLLACNTIKGAIVLIILSDTYN